jgi:DNA-binding PadR family transcriptional regulator
MRMSGKRRTVSSLLALAVLAQLAEGPMHPYEIAATLRSRGKEHSIKLNYGSLYTVVDNLAKHGLIEAVEARREGRRPERTVYRLTEAGQAELDDWMTELLSAPVKEYPQFEAALSLLPALGPDEVLDSLRQRVSILEKTIDDERAQLTGLRTVLPRLVLLETEYGLRMREAELDWVRGLVSELEDGSLPGLAEWRNWHRTGDMPASLAELSATAVADVMSGGNGRPGERAAKPSDQAASGPGEEPPD